MRIITEIEWLVAIVTDDDLAHLCKSIGMPQPTLSSRTPYKTMFTLIRDQLRERVPFPFEQPTATASVA